VSTGDAGNDRPAGAWPPPITDPELRERLAMDDRRFAEYLRGVLASLPSRAFEAAAYERAVGYPWARPEGSYLLTGSEVEPLAAMDPDRRGEVVSGLTAAGCGRVPLLAIGSNAAPQVLEAKFAHLDDEDGGRTVLALAGRLHDFDVGVAAQPALYGSMPATIFPSPGTEVAATLLWVTPPQFTQLTWSELSYRLGRLRARFEVEDGGEAFEEVLVFVSRFWAFCVDGRPVALGSIPARGRTAPALSQKEMLDAAAVLAIGPDAGGEALVRAVVEDIHSLVPRLVDTLHRETLHFSSEDWTPYGSTDV
jgi:hypothetical protein